MDTISYIEDTHERHYRVTEGFLCKNFARLLLLLLQHGVLVVYSRDIFITHSQHFGIRMVTRPIICISDFTGTITLAYSNKFLEDSIHSLIGP